jgi:ribosome biogenesis protein BMS1
MEDNTIYEKTKQNYKAEHDLVMFGFLRGSNFRKGCRVHVVGVGDFQVDEVLIMIDPCPLSGIVKRRVLNDRERLVYGPLAEISFLLYDNDITYIDVYLMDKNQKVFTNKNPDNNLKRISDHITATYKISIEPNILTETGNIKCKKNEKKTTESDWSDVDDDLFHTLDQSKNFMELSVADIYPVNNNTQTGSKFFQTSSCNHFTQCYSSRNINTSSEKTIRKSHIGIFCDSAIDLDRLVYGQSPLKVTQSEVDTKPDYEFVLKSMPSISNTPAPLTVEKHKILSSFLNQNQFESNDLLKMNNLEAATELKRSHFVAGDWEREKRIGISSSNHFQKTNINFKHTGYHNTENIINYMSNENRENQPWSKKSNRRDESKCICDNYEAYDSMTHEPIEHEMRTHHEKKHKSNSELESIKKKHDKEFRQGSYVRLLIKGMPCDLVNVFRSGRPLIVGGIDLTECRMGFLKVRLKRHRWYKSPLKTRDPLIISIGWRRYITIPTFAIDDHELRCRILKYTPKYIHCLAIFWGPLCPVNTEFVCLKSSYDIHGWRISAIGTILEMNTFLHIVKKLKLIGFPYQVRRHTALIQGMFNSQLEVANFEGATIRTVSGIRGIIKKAIRPGVKGWRPGSFRAVLEDKILLSDIVYLRTWVPLKIERLCSPVNDLLSLQEPRIKVQTDSTLESTSERHSHKTIYSRFKLNTNNEAPIITPIRSTSVTPFAESTAFIPKNEIEAKPLNMKNTAQIRREFGLSAPLSVNSLYLQVKRARRLFNPLKVSKALHAKLPFKSKPKLEPISNHNSLNRGSAMITHSNEI